MLSASFERKASTRLVDRLSGSRPSISPHGSRFIPRVRPRNEIGSEKKSAPFRVTRRRFRASKVANPTEITKWGVIDPSLFRPLRLISPLFPRFRISVTVSGAQLRKRSFTADRTCEACSRQHDVRVPSREWSRRRRVSGGAAQSLRRYVRRFSLSFLFSTLTIIRAKLVDSKGLETARDPIPHGSIRRYRHYRGGDGGGNLIFNERVAGTGGDTHDRPKVSTTSLLDARGTRGRKFVAGGRKKMIGIAREGCVTSQIPSKLNRVFLPSQLGPPARSTFSFYLYGRANSLMAPSSATRRKAT